MQSKTENRIRAWLMEFPGLVVSYSPQAVLREALKMFTVAVGTVPPTESNPGGLACDLPIFTDSLWRAGYRPDQRGADWILALPEKPTGNADWERIRRMNNITG